MDTQEQEKQPRQFFASDMIRFYFGQANWIAALLLALAFILTFLRGQTLWRLAAGFYSLGTFVSIGIKVYLWLFSVLLAFGFGDSGYPNFLALLGLPFPILVSFYAIASIVLLWPWISQKYAMRLGKILHLIIFPIFFAFIFVGEFSGHRGNALFDLQWLVYGPLWFRIREALPYERR
jgi:hypothetical protein